VAGGVAANQGLRERLAAEIQDVKVIIPPLRLCGEFNCGKCSDFLSQNPPQVA